MASKLALHNLAAFLSEARIPCAICAAGRLCAYGATTIDAIHKLDRAALRAAIVRDGSIAEERIYQALVKLVQPKVNRPEATDFASFLRASNFKSFAL